MKKLLLVPFLALLIGLCSVNGADLAGPPDGWGVAPSDGSTEEAVPSEPIATDTASDEPVTPLGGPPDGW